MLVARDNLDSDAVFGVHENGKGAQGIEQVIRAQQSGRENFLLYKLCSGRFLELVASGPAAVFGLERKGRLAAGADADFVVFDRDAEWTVDEEDLHYAVGWSPYHGMPVRGKVVSTWLRGRRIYERDVVQAPPGTGRFVRPA